MRLVRYTRDFIAIWREFGFIAAWGKLMCVEVHRRRGYWPPFEQWGDDRLTVCERCGEEWHER